MTGNSKHSRLGTYFGIATVIVYTLTTVVAMYLYPGPFSPLESTISHLGNATASPVGSAVFNAGNVLAGLLLLPFAASLAARGAGGIRTMRLAAAAGLVVGLGLAMIGLYPETVREIHVPVAVITFLSLTAMLVLINLAIRDDRRYHGWLLMLGSAAILANFAQIGLVLAGGSPTIVEWLSAYLPLAWIFFFCLRTLTDARD